MYYQQLRLKASQITFRNVDEMDAISKNFSQSSITEVNPDIIDSRCQESRELEIADSIAEKNK